MKMLYHADFDHFEKYDDSITGARYRKLDHGPVPDDASDALAALAKMGKVLPRKGRLGGAVRERFDPIEEPDLGDFTAQEADTPHEVVQRWAEHTTRRIEAATHGEAPWIAVRRNEVIPYHLAYHRHNHGAMDRDEDELEAPDGEEAVCVTVGE